MELITAVKYLHNRPLQPNKYILLFSKATSFKIVNKIVTFCFCAGGAEGTPILLYKLVGGPSLLAYYWLIQYKHQQTVLLLGAGTGYISSALSGMLCIDAPKKVLTRLLIGLHPLSCGLYYKNILTIVSDNRN